LEWVAWGGPLIAFGFAVGVHVHSAGQGSRGFTLVELMIVVAIIGILASVAVPNFIKFQARTKQSEAKTQLKALFIAERAFFAENDTYSAKVHALGFAPDRGNRYAYAAGTGGYESRSGATLGSGIEPEAIEVDTFKFPQASAQPVSSAVNFVLSADSAGGSTVSPPGVITGTNGAFAATATGTVDNDPEFDSWVICANMTLTMSASSCSEAGGFPAGIAANNYDDVGCP
jgi:type IV pilus assembly protein PilA